MQLFAICPYSLYNIGGNYYFSVPKQNTNGIARIIRTPHKLQTHQNKIRITFSVSKLLREIVLCFILLFTVTLCQRSVITAKGWLYRGQRIPGAIGEVIPVLKGAEIRGKRPGFKSDL